MYSLHYCDPAFVLSFNSLISSSGSGKRPRFIMKAFRDMVSPKMMSAWTRVCMSRWLRVNAGWLRFLTRMLPAKGIPMYANVLAGSSCTKFSTRFGRESVLKAVVEL